MNTNTLFKILINNKSCHGGDFSYKLAEWTPSVKPSICHSGYHLTHDPLQWWKPKATLWLAEGNGKNIKSTNVIKRDATVFESVRLLRQITKDDEILKENPRLKMFIVASMRSENPTCDISWADLRGIDLSFAYLSSCDLSYIDLSDSNLSHANLGNSNLTCSKLLNVNLFNTHMFYANLSKANLTNSDLSNAYLYEANLSCAKSSIAPVGWHIENDVCVKD